MIRIMIVDDMPIFLEYLYGCIDWNAYGFEICAAAKDGREALSLIPVCKPDVVLTDITMPYLNGIELTEKIQEKYPDISVILITGNNEFEYARKAVKIGVCDYIVKPFEKEELILSLLRLRDNVTKTKAMMNSKQEVERLGHAEALRSILLGENEGEYRKALEKAELGRNGDFYRICLLKLGNEAADKTEHFDDWEDVIVHLVSGVLEVEGSFEIFTDYDNNIVIFLSFDSKEEMDHYKTYEIEDLAKIIKSQLGIDAGVAISTPCESLSAVHEAYAKLRGMAGNGEINEENGCDARSKAVAKAVKEYVTLHHAESDMNVTDMAKALLINQTYLRQMFKDVTGMTIVEYITSYRMGLAKEMIQNSDKKLAEIAEEVGYSDISYFSKCFKKFYGVSPSSI